MSFNLDAVMAEDHREPFVFTFDSCEYVLPEDIDVAIASKLSPEKITEAMEMLLGPEQWEQIVASPKVLGVRALVALLTAYQKHLGIDVGESVASTSS